MITITPLDNKRGHSEVYNDDYYLGQLTMGYTCRPCRIGRVLFKPQDSKTHFYKGFKGNYPANDELILMIEAAIVTPYNPRRKKLIQVATH